jgi:hypothetical protein
MNAYTSTVGLPAATSPAVPEADVVPDLVRSLLAYAAWLEELAAAMRRLARPDAADVIAEGLVGLAAWAGAGDEHLEGSGASAPARALPGTTVAGSRLAKGSVRADGQRNDHADRASRSDMRSVTGPFA